MQELHIYTDGSCLGNPGRGGWAYVAVLDGHVVHEDKGHSPESTNNIMELSAALNALSWLGERAMSLSIPPLQKIHIWTDSQYVMNGVQQWSKNWINNNWKTAAGKPVKNQEVWKQLLSRTNLFNIEWHWVRGHNGNAMNERADVLARSAAENS